MANRLKTIQFAFPMTTGIIADATVTNLTQITLYIPETVVSFHSVTVDVGFQDIITATGGTIGEHRVGLRLGAAAYTTITETDDITNSGENMGGVIGPFDFTSHFTTNWSGTSMTCNLQVYFDQTTGTTLGMRNTTAIITITYEYDDTATTHIKTVQIPLESLVGTLPTAANSNFGTNQIPILTGASGMLPENSIVIRDYYFVIEGNEGHSAATDFTVTANIDSGSATAFGAQESALVSSRYCRWIYKPAVPTTTATHNLQLWTSLTARCHHVSVTLYVTYEFNHTNSTRILNSIFIPIDIGSPLGATTEADASRYDRDLFIEEPGTITLCQSAFRINYNCAATPTGLRLRAGSQAFRAYSPYAAVVVGMYCVQQRIDSGSSQGLGVAIARGKNNITVDGYITVTTNQVTNVNGYIILNYTSDKASDGAGTHSHTVFNNLFQWDALLADRIRVDGQLINIPESEYRVVSNGFILYSLIAVASNAVAFSVECLSTEAKAGGYYDIYTDAYQGDAERACSVVWMRGLDVFKRCPTDPDTNRIDGEQTRGYRLFTATTSSSGIMSFLTYHCLTINVIGTISGSAGGTVTINAYRSDTNELIYTTNRVGNGGYSFTWYDDVIPIYCEAYENEERKGRSVTAVANNVFDVALSRPIARASA